MAETRPAGRVLITVSFVGEETGRRGELGCLRLTLTCFLFTGRRGKHRRPSHHAFQQAEAVKRAAVNSLLFFPKGCCGRIYPSVHSPHPPPTIHTACRQERPGGLRSEINTQEPDECRGGVGGWKEERGAYDSSREVKGEGKRGGGFTARRDEIKGRGLI